MWICAGGNLIRRLFVADLSNSTTYSAARTLECCDCEAVRAVRAWSAPLRVSGASRASHTAHVADARMTLGIRDMGIRDMSRSCSIRLCDRSSSTQGSRTICSATGTLWPPAQSQSSPKELHGSHPLLPSPDNCPGVRRHVEGLVKREPKGNSVCKRGEVP